MIDPLTTKQEAIVILALHCTLAHANELKLTHEQIRDFRSLADTLEAETMTKLVSLDTEDDWYGFLEESDRQYDIYKDSLA